MNLRLLLITLVAAFTLASPQAQAESIAVLNFQQILHDSSAGKSVKEQLDAKQKSFQMEMSHKEEELKKEQDSLSQQKAVLSPDAFDKKVKAFRQKANRAQMDAQDKHNELDYALNSSLGQIQKTVLDIVGNLAKERGYTLVLPSSQLLYADPKLDITSEVLGKLNASLPSVNVSFHPPSKTNE